VTVVGGRFLGVAAGFCGVADRGSVMIIFGGAGEENVLNDVWVFCPTTKQWNPLELSPALPPRTHTSITTSEQTLYMFGGINEDNMRTSDIWRCDMIGSGLNGRGGGCMEIPTRGWTPHVRRSMMFALESVKSCQSDCGTRDPDKFLMFNGYYKPYETPKPVSNRDNETAILQSLPSIQTIPKHNGTSSYPHRCIAARPPFTDMFCDRECAYNETSFDCSEHCRCKRDFQMDVWEIGVGSWKWNTRRVSSGPSPRFTSQAVLLEEKLFMFGGLEAGAPPAELNDLWFFDLIRNEWRFLDVDVSSPTPPGRHEASLTWTEPNHGHPLLVVYGGIGAAGQLNDVWTCDLGDVMAW